MRSAEALHDTIWPLASWTTMPSAIDAMTVRRLASRSWTRRANRPVGTTLNTTTRWPGSTP